MTRKERIHYLFFKDRATTITSILLAIGIALFIATIIAAWVLPAGQKEAVVWFWVASTLLSLPSFAQARYEMKKLDREIAKLDTKIIVHETVEEIFKKLADERAKKEN